MCTIIHISDLHFGREKILLQNELLKSISQINPDLVVISGDLTQRARPDEFIAARKFIDTLDWPKIIVAGNHDIPAFNLFERFAAPWKRWRKYANYDLEPFRKGKGYAAVGINTARRCGAIFDWSRGRINSSQIEYTARRLQTADKETLRILVAHHPFWVPPEYEYRCIIGGGDEALQLLKRIGVDLILGGHVHSAYTIVLQGVIISHSGTAISSRLDQGSVNSYKIIRGNRQYLVLQTMEWRDTSYVPMEKISFNRTSSQWCQSSNMPDSSPQAHSIQTLKE